MPKLRFPEFRGAGEWEENQLINYLAESRIQGSKGDTAKKITVKLWGKGVFGKENVIQGSANTQYYRRKAGQFIYSKLDFLNQAFGIIPTHLDSYESTVDLPCFDIVDDIDLIFLLEYVQRKEFYEKYGETADGSRKARRIHADSFLLFPVFLPCVKEQQKIADCLSSLDELITLHTQKLASLKTRKKGSMQQLFPAEGETVPKLRFPEFQGAGEWEEKTLGEISAISSGGTPSRSKKAYWNGSVPWITTSLIDFNMIFSANEYISELGLKESSAKIFRKNTILMAMYGQGITRGKVALMGIEAATNQACAAITLKPELDSNFVFQNLASRYEKIRDISNAGGQENLSQGLIEKIPFTYPADSVHGIREQQKIADCLSSLDELITAQTQKIATLKTHKKGLMQGLFPSADEVNA